VGANGTIGEPLTNRVDSPEFNLHPRATFRVLGCLSAALLPYQ
jgi:hypothetical protein